MANRRSVLVGLGGLVAGGGALIGTGAFTTVEAERTVSVSTAGDGSAFLGLTPAVRNSDGSDNPYVEQTSDTVEITLENPGSNNSAGNATGLNRNIKITFRNLVTITNNGSQDITELFLEIIEVATEGGVDDPGLDSTFNFPVSPPSTSSAPGGSEAIADIDIMDNGADILESDTEDDDLTPGESMDFGIEVDLLNGGNSNSNLPDGEYTLQITAETQNTNSDNTNTNSTNN